MSQLELQRYKINDLAQDLIGQGSMGRVYKGQDTQTNTVVAIKALKAQFITSDPTIVERFAREGEILRQLNHPNIVKLLATIEIEGRPYLVLEYVSGGSLRNMLDEAKAAGEAISLERVLQIALELSDALARTHHLNIIHRDIKPENVLLATDGTPRLTDFGVSHLGQAERMTQTGSGLGTLDYLAPEALNGEKVDERADIWSLGVLLYEMLSQKRPFRGQTPAESLMAILTQTPDFDSFSTDLPDLLLELLHRMLAKDPTDRIASMRLVGAALESLTHKADASKTDQENVTILERGLGVEPMEDTQAAYKRLLNRPEELTTNSEERLQRNDRVPLVGRQQEWQTLQDVWTKASRGEPHFICLQGEAGIGKTRLAEELFDWVQHQGAIAARTRAYQVQGAMAYAPITELLRNETLNARLGQVESTWLGEIMRLLPELGETFPDLPQPQPMTESWQRQRLLEALTYAVLLDGTPLLILLDDLQWCESETLEWFDFLLRFNPQAPLLVVGTRRTGENIAQQTLDALYRNLQHDDLITMLSLQPLNAEETAKLAQLLSDTASTIEADKQLFDETAGNPLFVVETIRANLPTATTSPVQAEQAGLPPKIYAVIQSRLSHLSPEAQTVINLAAVIGRSFSYNILFEAARLDEDELIDCLDELWKRQIIRDQGTDAYDFAHDRMRDVAYAEISHPRRRQLHRRIANALETIHAPNLNSVVGELALHYEQIGDVEKAVSYYQKAANYAKSICAYEKVSRYANQGLTLLKSEGVEAPMPQLELMLQLSLGTSLSALNGYADPRVENAFQQAHKLSEALGEHAELYPILHGLTLFYMTRGEIDLAKQSSTRCLRLATTSQNRDFLIEANLVSGLVCFYGGEFSAARTYFEESYSHYDFDVHKAHYLLYTQDPAVMSLGYLGLSLWILGYPDQAMNKIRSTLTLVQKVAHPYTTIIAQFCLIWLYDLYQDHSATAREAKSLIDLSSKYQSQLWLLVGQIYECRALAKLGIGNKQEIINTCHNILVAYKQIGMELARQFFLEILAEIYFDTDQYEKGLETLDEALTLIQSSNERQVEAKCYLLQGDLFLSSNAALAEEAYLNAIRVSERQQAKSFELRATTHLARLYMQQGQIEKAYQQLSEIYGWFTEGFETHDLTQAKALLEELSSLSISSGCS